ncbi:MAG TPA: radical SAM protein [Syntrophobacter fumaroxidans]|nr:radical SAM protein [Syntrophobacter fumaroxidans]
MASFEQGPIRPPSEAGSLLLRFTRNCPWNKCTFCPVYKRREFSRRSLEEIKQDIDAVFEIIEALKKLSFSLGFAGAMNREVLSAVFSDPSHNDCFRHVAYWHIVGNGTVFIQDANSLMLPSPMLISALQYLRSKVPGITRITSYARSSTLARKRVEDLKEMRAAGLDRIHVGMESGSDRVLEFVKKGTTAAQHIEGGRRVIEAGMELSEYVMPGLGGVAMSEEHAVESARVLNAIDPHFIRLRSLRIPPRAPLFKDKAEGRFAPLSDDDVVREIRLFIETLDGIHSTLASDHIMNLLQDVEGRFPRDKPAMLATIDRYLALPLEERQLYRLGRRGGALVSLDDLDDPVMRGRLQLAMKELVQQMGGDLEKLITELADRYI